MSSYTNSSYEADVELALVKQATQNVTQRGSWVSSRDRFENLSLGLRSLRCFTESPDLDSDRPGRLPHQQSTVTVTVTVELELRLRLRILYVYYCRT